MHADHLSSAPYIQGKLVGTIGIGEQITLVQVVFGKVFNEGTECRRDGSQFDRPFKDVDTYSIGGLQAFVLHTPGQLPACMTHVIGDAAFVGDTLLMPDGGSARADFPGDEARTLFRSTRRILELPPGTRLFICHDHGPNGRDIRWASTVAEQRAHNIHNIERHKVFTAPALLSLRVDESLSFANARLLEDRILAEVAARPGVQHVVLMCSAVNMIDASAFESLEAIADRLHSAGVAFHLSEVKGPVMDDLRRPDVFQNSKGRVLLSHYKAAAALTSGARGGAERAAHRAARTGATS